MADDRATAASAYESARTLVHRFAVACLLIGAGAAFWLSLIGQPRARPCRLAGPGGRRWRPDPDRRRIDA